jgi:hypothetical protein
VLGVDHAKFERRRRAQDLLRLRRILHARQLHDDAIAPLALNNGLCDTQLIDTIAQRRDVLLQGEGLHLVRRLLVELDEQRRLLPILALGHDQLGELATDEVVGPRAGIAIPEAQQHAAVVPAGDSGVADLLFAQHLAQIRGVALLGLADGPVHVDLHQEVHAAAQIEAEIHRQGSGLLEP